MNTLLDLHSPRRSDDMPSSRRDDKRLKRILLLSTLFFASGLFFFAARIHSQQSATTEPLPVQGAAARPTDNPYVQLANFPDPTRFESFQFHAGMSTTTGKGTCTDTHIALMIYKSGDDYRQDPRQALFNTQYPCTKGTTYSIEIPLDNLHLIEGTKYYLIHAPQDTGAWYNPY